MSETALATTTPTERLPGEHERWYARFLRYLQAGPNRSLRQVFAEETGKTCKPHGSWTEAVKRYRWAERAAEYDALQHRKELEGYEARNERVRNMLWQSIEMLGAMLAQINSEIASGEVSRAERQEALAEVAKIHSLIQAEYPSYAAKTAGITINNLNAQQNNPALALLPDDQIDRILAAHGELSGEARIHA